MSLSPVTTQYTTPSNILANEHKVVLPIGITIDSANAEIPVSKIVLAGTAMAKITASGKFVPYKAGATGGQAVAIGLLLYDVDVSGGNEMGSLLIHGFVKEAALSAAVASTAKATMPQIFFV